MNEEIGNALTDTDYANLARRWIDRQLAEEARIRRVGSDNGQIDSAIADAEWERNTQTQAPPVGRRGQQPEDDAEVFGASQYTKARAVREHYQARLAKIDYEERIAKLVSGEEVQVAAFNKFRQFRDAMINLPDRLAAMLAAETVEATVHALLTVEIRKALNDFADESNG